MPNTQCRDLPRRPVDRKTTIEAKSYTIRASCFNRDESTLLGPTYSPNGSRTIASAWTVTLVAWISASGWEIEIDRRARAQPKEKQLEYLLAMVETIAAANRADDDCRRPRYHGVRHDGISAEQRAPEARVRRSRHFEQLPAR